MMSMDADVATVFAHFQARRLQVFPDVDFPVFSRGAASVSHKASDVHSQIGMDFPEKESRNPGVENFPRQAVTAVAPGNSITVHQKNVVPLQIFANEMPVHPNPQFPRKKILQGEIVVPHQQMDFRAKVRKIAKNAVQRKMPASDIMPVFVPKFEQVAHQKHVGGFPDKTSQKSYEDFFPRRNRTRRIRSEMGVGKEIGGQGIHTAKM